MDWGTNCANDYKPKAAIGRIGPIYINTHYTYCIFLSKVINTIFHSTLYTTADYYSKYNLQVSKWFDSTQFCNVIIISVVWNNDVMYNKWQEDAQVQQ